MQLNPGQRLKAAVVPMFGWWSDGRPRFPEEPIERVAIGVRFPGQEFQRDLAPRMRSSAR
jgi:hypothetical protein